MSNWGIASLGVAFPSKVLSVEALAELRGIDPAKYTKGLDCGGIALCGPGESVVTLGAEAARRALSRWDGNVEDIGLLAVGTETAQDMSRPLSAFIADELDLRGRMRSYEVKHACYGGTVALRQALEWVASGANRGKSALVIAVDEALYAQKDPGEPTSGAGAVAMIVGSGDIATIDLESYAWANPAFDFWRPVGDEYPSVDGAFSLQCYKDATYECFRQKFGDTAPVDALSEFHRIGFHVPFPKMVKKAVQHLGEKWGWSPEASVGFYNEKVLPTMDWNRETGNSYTAALWVAMANTLRGVEAGTKLAAFSYGSGFGSELLTMTAGPAAAKGAWSVDVETDFANRASITGAEYEALRATRK